MELIITRGSASGDRPGLQNRRVAGFPVTGGFDPPLASAKTKDLAGLALAEAPIRRNLQARRSVEHASGQST
jgi:hypothetical protein